MAEKTTYRGISCGGTGGSLTHVDYEDGKIVRIRPMRWDEKYTEDELKTRLWKLESRGKTLVPPMKTQPPMYAFGYKKRVYSKNRVQYPLKRIDWEPGGDPEKINAQNRGKSKYKRIGWDEASKIIASEVKRVSEKYGPNSIFCIGEDGHKESKDVHSGGGWHMNLMTAVNGTFTREVRTPDSVEGWYWGAKHVWGSGLNYGLGMMSPTYNVIKDVSDNTDMIVLQSGDWECMQNYASQYFGTILRWFLDLGIEVVVVDPFCNYSAVCHDEIKWIPILPNTDAALDFAIIYTWLDEDTYDHDYVNTHVVGFDKVVDYVMGKEDGIPKTPAWASEKCGIPEWTIKALARNQAKLITTIGHYCGTMVRGPYSHECARTEVYKLAMQGLGKPGVQQMHLESWTVAWPKWSNALDPQPPVIGQRAMQFVPQDQQIPRTMVMHAIEKGDIEWWGTPQIIYAPGDEQFERYQYPSEDNGAPVHMLWSEKPCNQGCWNGGFEFQEAMRSPQVECYITNHQWIENDSLFADLILPVSTCLEERDNTGCSQGDSVVTWAQAEKASDTVGESKSDYEIAQTIAAEFGDEAVEAMTQNMTVDEWMDYAFNQSPLTAETTLEEVKEKGYYICEFKEDWDKMAPGMRDFHDDPENNPMDTPTGLLEFWSDALAENFPDDKERQPMAKWIEGGPASEGWTHDETLWGERAKKYPLLMNSCPARWRMHVQGDDITWFREIETCKVKGPDGYLYEPLWLSPREAEKRGLHNGDIVKIYNERGIILGGVRISERVMDNSVYMTKGARVDPIGPGIDRGGSTNLLSPSGPISKHCWGFVVTGYLVEVEKLSNAELDEWKQKYPDAFERLYDPAVGINYDSWVI